MLTRRAYLIICDSPKQAITLYNEVVERCLDEKVEIARVSRYTLTLYFEEVSIRFVSRSRACDALTGFDGMVRMGWEFELLLHKDNFYDFVEPFNKNI